jgi:hypothetical protein
MITGNLELIASGIACLRQQLGPTAETGGGLTAHFVRPIKFDLVVRVTSRGPAG